MYLYWNSQYEKPSAGKVRSKYRLQIYYLSYIQDFCIPHLDKIVFCHILCYYTNLISLQRKVSSVRVMVHDIGRIENIIFIPDADGSDPSTNSDSSFESCDFISSTVIDRMMYYES